jgi:hypothetical protein
MLNKNMTKKYDWAFIQQEYDTGLSQREIYAKHGVSSVAFLRATQRGDFKSRSKSEAGKIDAAKNPRIHTEQFKEQQRQKILSRYESGWMPKSGRCKKYKYISRIAGEVYLDGTWELAVAKWLDAQNYIWKRNTKRFPYYNLKGVLSHYTPDFWVQELDGYLEVKGYETALDRCKWSQFTEPLTVWKKSDLKDII